MKTFTHERAASPQAAAAAALARPGAKFIASGTNLLDLMKLEVETPPHLIDITRLGLDTLEPTAACASAPWCAMPTLPPMCACAKVMQC